MSALTQTYAVTQPFRGSPAAYTDDLLLNPRGHSTWLNPDSPPLVLESIMEEFEEQRNQVGLIVQQYRNQDPDGFAVAALLYLANVPAGGPAASFISSLVFHHPMTTQYLLDSSNCPMETSLRLAQQLAAVDKRFDARLVSRLFERSKGVVESLDAALILRSLLLVQGISNGSRLLPYLVKLLRHWHPRVRRRALRMIGQGNFNEKRTEQFLANAQNPRERASVVVSLWPHAHRAVSLLTQAAADPHHLVSAGALVGLCCAGHPAGVRKLTEMASSDVRVLRQTALRAIVHTGLPEFIPLLERFLKDESPEMQALASRSLIRMQGSTPDGYGPDPEYGLIAGAGAADVDQDFDPEPGQTGEDSHPQSNYTVIRG